MSRFKRIAQAQASAKILPVDQSSKLVLMSDCHRSDGNWNDDFAKNQNLAFSALSNYFDRGFTYIELGDGDELWETPKMGDIIAEYSHMFWLLDQFHTAGRLHMLYGNHDVVKRSERWREKNCCSYTDERTRQKISLFKDIEINESIILKSESSELLLLHGHQADFFNDRLWRLSRFLVRFVWKPLQLIGVHDPLRSSQNVNKRDRVESILTGYADKNNIPIIAGHTHRPVFAGSGGKYYNDGSAVHPRCITALEIENGKICLVKWCVSTKTDGTLYVAREVLSEHRRIID